VNSNDVLYYYRAKDADEKLFNQIKVEMEGNRIRTHNEEATGGKIFVIFLALIIRTYMRNKLKKIQKGQTRVAK
jgi:transposase